MIVEEKYYSFFELIRIVEFCFKKFYFKCVEIEVILLVVMILLMKYVYNSGFCFIKFIIYYGLIYINNEWVDFIVGNVILVKVDNVEVFLFCVYNEILK